MNGWKIVHISDFCTTGTGGTPSRSNMERYYGGGKIPWVKSGELRETVINNTEEHVTEEALKETHLKLVPSGALLLAMYGATVGRLGILGTPATTNQAICHIIPDPIIADVRYLFHLLRSQVPNIVSRGVGGAQPNISQGIVKDLKIPIPPIEEQKRISDILDRAEALRAKRRVTLDHLDELTQSIFTEMFGDPMKNPKNWKLEEVQDVISQIEAGWSANGEFRPREENEYAVLKVSAVTQGVFLPEECKVINNNIEFKKVVTPEKGDVLFSRANTLELVGASCFIRENYPYLLLPDKLWKIRVNEEKICPEYFKFALSYPTIRHEISKHSTGTSGSMYNISTEKFRLIKITVPPIPLQCEFARRIASIEKLKEAHKASLAELDELFASLQYRAFRRNCN